MDSINRVVVGVAMPKSRPWDSANLDPASRIAVRQAFHLAGATGNSLHVMTVLPEMSDGFFGTEDDAKSQADADQAEAQQVLDSLLDDYASLNVAVATQVTFGRPWLELLTAAGGARETLICCGTREKNAVSRLLFGSTGLKLLRNAPGPVWLIKPRIDDDAVMDVLAATDLSEIGVDVISAGVTLGRALPVKLTVMHVADMGFQRQMAHSGASDEQIESYRNEARATAEKLLQEQLTMTDYRTVSNGVQTQLAEGVADASLLTAIEELDIDLLIMATSGRGAITGMLFGNTAERILSSLACSLMALKPDDFECPIPLAKYV